MEENKKEEPIGSEEIIENEVENKDYDIYHISKNKEKIPYFKKVVHAFKKGWIIILMMTLIGTLTGLVIADKTYHKKYQEENYVVLNFRYTEEADLSDFNYKDIISQSNIERCKKLTKSLETGSALKTYQYVEIEDGSINIVKNKDSYTIKASPDSFNVSADGTYNDSAAKGFLKHLTLLPFISDEEIEAHSKISEKVGHDVFKVFDKTYYEENSLDENKKIIIEYANPDAVNLNKEDKINYFRNWIMYFTLGFILISLILLIVLAAFIDKIVVREYDNKKIFRTPFHLSFFNGSLKAFKDIKSLVIMSLLLAAVMVCKFIPIPSGFGELGIGFGFLFLATACMLFGPYPALVIGLLSDVIGYMIKPDGMFFIGYTFQAMLACFAYSLCLHKTYVTFTRCFIARVIVNLVCNVIIGGISWGIISKFNVDQTITYILTTSLPKNLVYLLPQSLVLFIVLKAILRPVSAFNLADEKIAKTVSLF